MTRPVTAAQLPASAGHRAWWTVGSRASAPGLAATGGCAVPAGASPPESHPATSAADTSRADQRSGAIGEIFAAGLDPHLTAEGPERAWRGAAGAETMAYAARERGPIRTRRLDVTGVAR